MQDDPLSHGLWELTAPPGPPTPPLQSKLKVDVAVVGCGYTGLAAALRLAEGGAKVAALEAVEVGFGAAGRNVGLVNAGMWVMPQVVLKGIGADYGERLLTLLGGGPAAVWETIEKHAIDCDPVRNGTLHCAVGRAGREEIEERARQWRERGAPVRALDAAEAAERIGSTAYSGALLDLRAGTIQPLAYARGLARAAIAAGAAIHAQSPVLRAERSRGVWVLQAGQGSVTADWVAVATDAYGGAPWPEVRREQVLLPYFNFATAPLPAELKAAILPGRE
ncbi:MAG: FAD-binding oxidoreductase, partial [Hyphomicrobiales bacterium]|nr:FAD-binding oxidoreductase [Hyphomicrobiales bacterium]